MPDVKISAGADPGTLLATDKAPIARSGSTTAYAATMAEVATYANGAYVPNYSTGVPAMDGTASPGTAANVSRGDHVHPSDTSRAPLASPVFTGDPQAPTAAVGDNDQSVATTSFVQQAVTAGVAPYAHNVGRNRLHNSGFSINQRSYTSGTALAAAAYGHDRWKAGAAGCTYTFTQSQPFTTITITAGSLQQIVEAMNVEGGTYTLSWTGTAQGRVNAGSYAASPVTVTGLAVNTAITVEFNAGMLGRVQLEIGTIATPLEKPDPRYDLSNCQRFFQIGTAQLYGYSAAASVPMSGMLGLPATMRAVPTVTPTWTTQINTSSPALGALSPSALAPTVNAAALGNLQLTGTFTASADL